MDNLTLTLHEAAEAMNVSEPTMREIVRRSDFPAIRAGRRWVIPSREFVDWLGKQAFSRTTLFEKEA